MELSILGKDLGMIKHRNPVVLSIYLRLVLPRVSKGGNKPRLGEEANIGVAVVPAVLKGVTRSYPTLGAPRSWI